jgi:Domain of unknown function (DUF1844)
LVTRQDISVSSLWTPSGEHQPEPEPDPAAPAGSAQSAVPASSPPASAGGGATPEEEAAAREEFEALRQELAETPVAAIVANHAVGLWQLGVLHLALEGDMTPRLDEAKLAIDAMAALVEGLGDDLGPNEQPLRDALAQLRLAYVEVKQRVEGAGSAES